MIKSILWKEWREQQWKLAFGTVMLLFFTGSLLASRIVSDNEVVLIVWLFGGFLLALYSAMGVFAPEHSNKTTTFLASKPLEAWKVFACKWFVGWLNFAVPLMICSLVLGFTTIRGIKYPGTGPRIMGMDISGTLGAIALSTMFYTLTCCLAPCKSSEAFVGFTGLIVFFAMIIHITIFSEIIITPSYLTGLTLFQQMILFINPLFWIHLIKPLHDTVYVSVLILEQATVFSMVLWFGLRKWQRNI